MDGIAIAECLVSETQDTKDEASSDHCSGNGTTSTAAFNLWAHGLVALADSIHVVPGIYGLLWDIHKIEVLWWSRRSRGGSRRINCGLGSGGGTVLVCGTGVRVRVRVGVSVCSAGVSSAATVSVSGSRGS